MATVTPAEAGVQVMKRLDSRFHGNDARKRDRSIYSTRIVRVSHRKLFFHPLQIDHFRFVRLRKNLFRFESGFA